MNKHDIRIVTDTSAPASDRSKSAEQKIDERTIDGSLPEDDDPPSPRGGGGVALPVPKPDEDQWGTSLAAFERAAEDMSRAARNVQLIRHPLEGLARNIAKMTIEIAGMHEELSQLRRNLSPPISVETTSMETVRVKHDGHLGTVTTIKPPTISRRMKSIAWYVVRAMIGGLAAWGAVQAIGWFWPELVNISKLLT